MSNNKFKFYNSGERPTVRFNSDMMVYEECLQGGRYVGLYWSASGQVQRENLTIDLPENNENCSFELEIDGQKLNNNWEWEDEYSRSEVSSNIEEVVVVLKHKIRPISLNIVTCLDGSPILTRWLEITNNGSSSAALSHISPLRGLLWTDNYQINMPFDYTQNHPYTLGYLKSKKWGEEGNFIWKPLPSEIFRIEREIKPYGSPYFIIKNNITGELYFIGLGWSANYFAEFHYNNQQNTLSFSSGPVASSPQRVIEPGETIKSPEIHIGPMHSDLDSAAHNWHQHLRSSVIPKRPDNKKMYTIGARVVEEPGDWILREIDLAEEMGVEAFMVDAGWYGENFSDWVDNRGDWFEGSWLPGKGINTIRKYVQNKEMLFGLWMEPETMGDKSRLLKEHPDWKLTNDLEKKSNSLNLAKPEVAKFVKNSVFNVIRDFKLDFFKIDYNNFANGQNKNYNYLEDESWKHYEVIYGLFDQILDEFPDIVLENCAGGGGRNDLGMMSRFHYACESDWSIMPHSIRAINAMTLFLPPEAICYYHNHIGIAHQTADLETHLRVTLFAVPIFVGFGAQKVERESQYFKETKKYIELSKNFCRSIMKEGPVVYHHTPDIGVFKPAEWCVLEYAASDKLKGYTGIFKLKENKKDYIFKAKGVDMSKNYKVKLYNNNQEFTISGKELTNKGLRITLETSNTSELITYIAQN